MRIRVDCPRGRLLIQLTLASAVLLLSILDSASADDWPQFLGPEQNGRSAETGLAQQWPDSGPPRLWLRKDLGVGYSGPAVVGDRVYIMASRGEEELLLALDLGTGQDLWAAPAGGLYKNEYGDGPRGTPTVKDGLVYALSASGLLICVRADSGAFVWKASLTDFGGETPGWGYSESPLVDGDRVVCTPGGHQGAVVAFDRRTGELQWQSRAFVDLAQYTSLAIVEVSGMRQYVVLTRDHLAGIAADDGQLMWQTDFVSSVVVSTAPLVAGQQIFVSAGGGTGGKSVQLAAADRVDVVYENKLIKSLASGLVLVDGHMFGYSDGRGWVCQNFVTGDLTWSSRDLEKGSAVAVDDLLICLTEEQGNVVLADASPRGWRERSRFRLKPLSALRKPKGRVWTHPVVSGGKLLVRDQELLHCYDVR